MPGRLASTRIPLLLALAVVLVAGCSRIRSAPVATTPPEEAAARLQEFWSDPGNAALLDLYRGAADAFSAPPAGATFRFLEKDTKGFSPGWDVVDEAGTRWSVKLGPEAYSEVVASRLVWALGFHQPPTFHVPSWSLSDGPEPGPQPAGRFRPVFPGQKRQGPWSWERNPYAGTQEFRGLLVLMRILNNWDLLDRNNEVFDFGTPRRGATLWYVVLDLGAALGKTHGLTARHSGTRGDVADFEGEGFVEGVRGDGFVDFDDLGKWHRGLFSRLTPQDVRWTCTRLQSLSDRQLQDAFRAGGYGAPTTERYVAALRNRIRAGLALANAPAGEP